MSHLVIHEVHLEENSAHKVTKHCCASETPCVAYGVYRTDYDEPEVWEADFYTREEAQAYIGPKDPRCSVEECVLPAWHVTDHSRGSKP